MSRNSKQQVSKSVTNIVAASSEAASLSNQRTVQLPGGRSVTIHRLSWIEFEALWTELSALVAALLALDENAALEGIGDQLNMAPSFVLKLASISARCSEKELSAWYFDDVLTVAGAALQLSFAEGAGVRSFFTALSELSGVGE